MDNVAMINMQPVCYAAIYLEFFHNRAHVDECFRY
ncbi:Uncharacterised protein [Escherichia coli]|nr:Uncharacterised protein [Escherichia coli]